MSWILGFTVPVVLVVVCIFVLPWYGWFFLALFVLVTTFSTSVQRFGRAGFFPSCTTTEPPVVVGGGWSWVLRRDRTCPPTRMLCSTGRVVDDTGEWWHAGTTIAHVQKVLSCEGRTLASHPSILSATLGGWIASQSHGTGGTLWTPTIGEIVVEHEGTYHTLRSKKQFSPGMIIHRVRLHTVANVVCERRVFAVTSQKIAQNVLVTPTYLRAIFVDRYRSLAFVWIPCASNETSRETFPPPWLAMILPSWVRYKTRYPPRRMTLRDANRFSPIDPPLLLATPLISSRINFEVFINHPTSGSLLWDLCRSFEALFASGVVSGRMELRFGSTKQFLDFDLARTNGCSDSVFQCIRKVYGTSVTWRLHPGKAQCAVPG